MYFDTKLIFRKKKRVTVEKMDKHENKEKIAA
jgi:hypothetical protein